MIGVVDTRATLTGIRDRPDDDEPSGGEEDEDGDDDTRIRAAIAAMLETGTRPRPTAAQRAALFGELWNALLEQRPIGAPGTGDDYGRSNNMLRNNKPDKRGKKTAKTTKLGRLMLAAIHRLHNNAKTVKEKDAIDKYWRDRLGVFYDSIDSAYGRGAFDDDGQELDPKKVKDMRAEWKPTAFLKRQRVQAVAAAPAAAAAAPVAEVPAPLPVAPPSPPPHKPTALEQMLQ